MVTKDTIPCTGMQKIEENSGKQLKEAKDLQEE